MASPGIRTATMPRSSASSSTTSASRRWRPFARPRKPEPRSWAGADEFGTLEAGKLADVLVVDGDVLADIRVLEDRARFIAVMQGGVIKAGQLLAPGQHGTHATTNGAAKTSAPPIAAH